MISLEDCVAMCGLDPEEIAATFKSGVLTVTLPKTPAAQKQEAKITVKAA